MTAELIRVGRFIDEMNRYRPRWAYHGSLSGGAPGCVVFRKHARDQAAINRGECDGHPGGPIRAGFRLDSVQSVGQAWGRVLSFVDVPLTDWFG